MRPRAAARHARAGLALLATLAAGACQRAPEEVPAPAAPPSAAKAAGETLATFSGHSLTTDDVMKQVEQMAPPARAYLSTPERKRSFLDNLVTNELLYLEGVDAGYAKDPDIERQVDNLRKRLVVQKVMLKYQTPPAVSDEEARAYYDQNPFLYSTTQIRASHILVKDEDTARRLLAEVRAHPEKFADIAREKSTDTVTAQKGGDLGLFGQGRMVADFERAAFSLKPGEISDVVKTQYGYHIITVTERKEGERRAFEQVKDQILTTLKNKARQTRLNDHIAELKKNADLKIDEAALGRFEPGAGMPATPPRVTGGH